MEQSYPNSLFEKGCPRRSGKDKPINSCWASGNVYVIVSMMTKIICIIIIIIHTVSLLHVLESCLNLHLFREISNVARWLCLIYLYRTCILLLISIMIKEKNVAFVSCY